VTIKASFVSHSLGWMEAQGTLSCKKTYEILGFKIVDIKSSTILPSE
jgi:hypothetical protein